MTYRRRIEAMEVAYYRQRFASFAPPGFTVDAFIDAAIAWLEKTPEQQQASMPQFTPTELAEITAQLLPQLRRARWAGR